MPQIYKYYIKINIKYQTTHNFIYYTRILNLSILHPHLHNNKISYTIPLYHDYDFVYYTTFYNLIYYTTGTENKNRNRKYKIII